MEDNHMKLTFALLLSILLLGCEGFEDMNAAAHGCYMSGYNYMAVEMQAHDRTLHQHYTTRCVGPQRELDNE
jgi:hypothetical protein